MSWLEEDRTRMGKQSTTWCFNIRDCDHNCLGECFMCLFVYELMDDLLILCIVWINLCNLITGCWHVLWASDWRIRLLEGGWIMVVDEVIIIVLISFFLFYFVFDWPLVMFEGALMPSSLSKYLLGACFSQYFDIWILIEPCNRTQ